MLLLMVADFEIQRSSIGFTSSDSAASSHCGCCDLDTDGRMGMLTFARARQGEGDAFRPPLTHTFTLVVMRRRRRRERLCQVTLDVKRKRTGTRALHGAAIRRRKCGLPLVTEMCATNQTTDRLDVPPGKCPVLFLVKRTTRCNELSRRFTAANVPQSSVFTDIDRPRLAVPNRSP